LKKGLKEKPEGKQEEKSEANEEEKSEGDM
jgi:hypothetical protein